VLYSPARKLEEDSSGSESEYEPPVCSPGAASDSEREFETPPRPRGRFAQGSDDDSDEGSGNDGERPSQRQGGGRQQKQPAAGRRSLRAWPSAGIRFPDVRFPFPRHLRIVHVTPPRPLPSSAKRPAAVADKPSSAEQQEAAETQAKAPRLRLGRRHHRAQPSNAMPKGPVMPAHAAGAAHVARAAESRAMRLAKARRKSYFEGSDSESSVGDMEDTEESSEEESDGRDGRDNKDSDATEDETGAVEAGPYEDGSSSTKGQPAVTAAATMSSSAAPSPVTPGAPALSRRSPSRKSPRHAKAAGDSSEATQAQAQVQTPGSDVLLQTPKTTPRPSAPTGRLQAVPLPHTASSSGAQDATDGIDLSLVSASFSPVDGGLATPLTRSQRRRAEAQVQAGSLVPTKMPKLSLEAQAPQASVSSPQRGVLRPSQRDTATANAGRAGKDASAGSGNGTLHVVEQPHRGFIEEDA
jgi:hypothetical protein